jgi:hypothetical protein
MRKFSKQIAVLLLIASFYSCSKSSSPLDPMTAETWPQSWILTVDFNQDTYKYLHMVGIIINRNNVEKTYSMTQLAKEADCNWEVKQEGQVNGKTVYSFHLKNNKNIRWIVSKTGNVNGFEEWYLGTHNGSTPPTGDYWKFYIHFMGKFNGNKIVVIESVAKPGYYLSDYGHTLAANGVLLVEHDRPEEGTHFETH